MSDSTSSGSTSPGRCGSTPSWWRCSARWCGSEWACYVVTDAASSVARTGGTDCWRALAAQARQLAGQGEVACGIRAGIRAVAAKGDPVGPDSGGRVESQTARALTATRTACPTHPQQRAAVDPARVLEVTPYALAGTRHGFLGEYQTLTRREDAPERQDRTPGLRIEHRTALQRDCAPVLAGVYGHERDPVVRDRGGQPVLDRCALGARLRRWLRATLLLVRLEAVDGPAVRAGHDALDRPGQVGHLVADEEHLLDRVAVEARRERGRQEEQPIRRIDVMRQRASGDGGIVEAPGSRGVA